MRVFNPSNRNQSHAATYRKHELEKKRAYQQRVQEVEHSSFTPLVLSVTGGMGVEASLFYKRLSSLLAQKWDITYNKTLCWLRCRLTFSLLRSAIQAIRGARSSVGHAARTPIEIDLISAESHLRTVININNNYLLFYMPSLYMPLIPLIIIFTPPGACKKNKKKKLYYPVAAHARLG